MTIRIENVHKSFKDFRALSGVDLTVNTGELIALLGPSGSGKTTLLRIIAGLDVADKGEIYLGMEKSSATPVRERRVGFVFQHYALFRHMTVFENVAFGLKIKGKNTRLSDDAIKEKVMELIDLVHLPGMHNRYPSQLSGGQRQRVALARALAVDPKVLLLDEPFGALDAKVRKELRRWLIRLHEELNITTIFVTHDQEEAMELADRVVVMNEGRIEQTGTPSEIYHHPANAFVYDFIGNYNAFTGWRIGGKGDYRLLQTGEESPANAETVQMFARPYDMEVSHEKTGEQSFPARILHINPAGPLVTVEMEDCAGKMIQASLPHEKFSSLNLSKGLDVFVRPRELRVFEK